MTQIKRFKLEDSSLINNIDRILVKLCNDYVKKEYFLYYIYKKAFLNNNMYPFIQEKIEGFTKHDFLHIQGVLKNIYEIIKDRLEYVINERDKVVRNKNYTDQTAFKFDFYEIYYLMIATIYHDAGLIFGRANHGLNLRKVLDKEIHLYGNILKDICNLACAHTGNNAIERYLKSDIIYSPEQTQINIHFLASILRIADEFQEGPGRTNLHQLLNYIKRDNQIYHFFSHSVQKVNFNTIDKYIELIIVIRFEDCHVLKFKLKFLNLIISRIKKYLGEIKYCIGFDVKNLLFNYLKCEIVYFMKLDTRNVKHYELYDSTDFEKFEIEIKKIFKEEII